MAISVNRTHLEGNGFPLTIRDKERNDSATSILLWGKGEPEYGELVMENLLHMLENFASPTPPANPIEGQLWFDLNSNHFMFYSKNRVWTPIRNIRNAPESNPQEGSTYYDSSTGIYYIFNTNLQKYRPINVASTTTKPTNPEVGDLWYDVNQDELKVWNGTVWRTASGPAITLADNAPANKTPGDLWFDTKDNSKTTFIWNGSSWLPVSNQYNQATPPQDPVDGTLWYDNQNEQLFAWDNLRGWILIGPSGQIAQDAAPLNPDEGDLWWNTIEKRLYGWDSASQTWKLIGPNVALAASPPGDPVAGSLWFNTADKVLNVWDISTNTWRSAAPTSFTGLIDTPSSFAGHGNKLLRVAPNEGSISFVTAQDAFSALLDNLLPAGMIIPYAGNTIPSGWIECDGSTLTQNNYPKLFAAIGTTYNNTTLPAGQFKVPDYRGRTLIGAGTGPGLAQRLLGQTGGEQEHTLTVGEMPSHSHNITLEGQPLEFDVFSAPASGNQLQARGDNLGPFAQIQNTGGGMPHNNMPPFAVSRWLIKT